MAPAKERDLFVFSAYAKLVRGLTSLLKPSNKRIARLDGTSVGNVAGHEPFREDEPGEPGSQAG
jgi:hypothetical protein